MKKGIIVLLVLALLCTAALAAKRSRHHNKQHNKTHTRAARAVAPLPQPPVEVDSSSPDYYGQITFYSVSPQLVPAGYGNYTLYAYSSYYLPQGEPLCCVFGSTLYSSNATNYGYSIYCPIPAIYSSGVQESYVAYCSDLYTPISNEFVVVLYDGLPTISNVEYDGTLYAIGGQNITITLSNLPDGDFYTFTCRPSNSYTWTSTTLNSNTVVCTTGSVPIGSNALTVQVSFNSSSIYSESYTVTFKSVRIQDYSPSSGCIVGNANVTLTLDAPVSSTGYYYSLPQCHFTPDYYDISAIRIGEHKITPLQYDAQTSTFFCLTPAWNYAESTATLTLVDPYEQSAISNPVSFDFITECLNNLDNNEYCAIGNVPVFINGEGLPSLGYTAYAYIYADMDMTELIATQTFYFLNSTTGYYLTSTYQYGYETTYVKISTYYSVISPNFTVTFTNSCISYITPKSLPIAGGDVVTLTFNNNIFTSANQYTTFTCLFIDPENYHLPQPATVVAMDQVTCVSPPVSEKGVGSVALAMSVTYPTQQLRTTSPVTIHFS